MGLMALQYAGLSPVSLNFYPYLKKHLQCKNFFPFLPIKIYYLLDT
jgi:hypothetical protein